MNDQPIMWMGQYLNDLPAWLLDVLEKQRILRVEDVILSDTWRDAL